MTKQETQKILNHPTTHRWIKNMAVELENHDVVDVLNGLDLLHSIFKSKFGELPAQDARS